MPDLLTHVLTGYTLATLLGLRYDWLTPQFATVAMIGATLPDFNRLELVVPSYRLERYSAIVLDGLPFSASLPSRVPMDWGAIHTLPASLVLAGLGAMLVPERYQLRVFACLALGAVSHHALDTMLVSTAGRSYDVLWPLVQYSPPTPGLYSSRDPWLAGVAVTAAAIAWFLRRRAATEQRAA